MPRRTENSRVERDIQKATEGLSRVAASGWGIEVEEVRELITKARTLFRNILRKAEYDDRKITALLTKFTDAGRRSAPWRPTSSRVPGRPQDGADGNRIRRWLLPEDHKFYANETDATLVEVKYIFQTLSMTGAPEVPRLVVSALTWLLGHEVVPGAFRDPIQLCEVEFDEFIETPRLITSGHLVPLDREGRHVPSNTSLMLKISNDLQGNNTVEELLDLIREILVRHGQM